MKLFYSPGACSLAPHILLEELGVPYEPVLIATAKGQQLTPEYLAINPKGRVPALAIDDRILTEVTAILYYLAASYPEARLLPDAGEPLARYLEWASWLTSEVHASNFAAHWRPGRFAADESVHSVIKEHALQTIQKSLSAIEARLQNQGYALGDRYTLLDPYLLVFYRWGNRVGVNMAERFPHWTKIALRVFERPAVQRTFELEGVKLSG